MKNTIILISTDLEDILKIIPKEGANFTHDTYAYLNAEEILSTTLSGFDYVNSKNTLSMVVAIHSDKSMAALGKVLFEPQLERAEKIADTLSKTFSDRQLIIIFFDEKTPANLYRALQQHHLTKTLHKWSYTTNLQTINIEGVQYFNNAYVFPMTNVKKTPLSQNANSCAQLQKIELIDLESKVKNRHVFFSALLKMKNITSESSCSNMAP